MQSLWLPDGYGIGTIIYDNKNNPYEAIKNLMGVGVGIYEVVPVDKEYAKARIAQGMKVLASTEVKVN